MTLLPIAILVLTLVAWLRNAGAGVGHAWMLISLLLSGFVMVVGIQEAMRSIYQQGSIIRCVIAVVAILCGTAAAGLALVAGLPGYGCGVRTVSEIRLLNAKLEEYRKRNGIYPATEQWAHALGVDFKDAYDRDYVYRYPGKRYPNGYDLFSAGPDRVADTADDEWGKKWKTNDDRLGR